MGSEKIDRVDLVLPVYNEARVLAGSVERVAAAMADRQDWDWRVVVADNGSTDGTAALARQLAEASPSVRLVALRTTGRGYALRNVWTETDADYSIYMDVDLSTDLEAIPLSQFRPRPLPWRRSRLPASNVISRRLASPLAGHGKIPAPALSMRRSPS